MTQNRLFAFVLAGGLLFSSMQLSSCGKNDEATQENGGATTEQSASSENASNNVSTANVDAANAPKAKAMAAETLKGFIPSIGGYKAEGETETVQLSMSGQEYAFAKQRFVNGEKMIEVTVADYNHVQGLSAAYSMMMGMSVETNTEATKGEKFGNFPGWVTYKKDKSSAQAGVAISDHIWVIVQADNGVSIDEVRGVINSMDLSKLASAH